MSGTVRIPTLTPYYGTIAIYLGAIFSLIGVALHDWVVSKIGDATVTGGIWKVCTIDVPFIADACDPIESPSGGVISTRLFAVLQTIAAIVTGVIVTVATFFFRSSFFLFTSAAASLGSTALGFLATISWVATAQKQVSASETARFGAGFAIMLVAWLMLLLGGVMFVMAYLIKLQELKPQGDRRTFFSRRKRRNAPGGAAAAKQTGGDSANED